ncbi:MAG TPA: hypothetical protein VNF07_05595 [Acidimicrobiales bacterium]|nr:hypothetical protein [Acidimicrobiales bacterium]
MVTAVATVCCTAAPGAATTAANVLITPGQLQLIGGTPANIGFSATALSGSDQSTTGLVSFDVSDATGSGAGWRIEGSGTAFMSASGRVLPGAGAEILSRPTASCDTGSGCVAPIDSVSYPFQLPSETAATLFDAAAGSGMGNATVAVDFDVSLPATTIAGTYSATWSFTLISGP